MPGEREPRAGREWQHRYARPAVIIGHVVVLAAVLTCLRLGWWQLQVTESARGTGQNLGYTLLWPVFAGSFVYMWLKFLRLETERDAAERAEAAAADPGFADLADRLEASARTYEASASATADQVARPEAKSELTHFITGVGVVGGDDEEDPELAAYNRALAELAEQDERRAN